MASPTSLPANEATNLLNAFTSFLTVAIHSLLYHRALYPATSFLTARAHNLPVHQSRHPGVCAWVRDAVAAAEAQIRNGAARSVALVIHGPPESLAVMERWVFDLQSFPATWGAASASAEQPSAAATTTAAVVQDLGVGPSAGVAGGGVAEAPPAEDDNTAAINWTDVNESLRGALCKIAYAAERSSPLPENCTFTLAVELRDQAPAPIGHPQSWIPVDAKKQQPGQSGGTESDAGRDTTMPIRSVSAGPLFFECWLEKGATSDTQNTSSGTQNTS